MHFDEEMGFQFLGPRSTVLSPSDPRPPTVEGAGQGGKGTEEMGILMKERGPVW